MPEQIRALVVILVLAASGFWLARHVFVGTLMKPEDFSRRRNLWFLVTLTAFLSHNFWVFMIVSGILISAAKVREKNPLVVYCLLIAAVPVYRADVPGFGLINYLISVDFVRLLNLVVLLPVSIGLWRRKGEGGDAGMYRLADVCIGAYVLLVFTMQALEGSFTGGLRLAFYQLIDVVLPYYAGSRAWKHYGEIRESIAAFVLGMGIIAVIGVFEMARNWMLYDELGYVLGVSREQLPAYLYREGLARARATTLQPIVLGFVIMVAIGLFGYLAGEIRKKRSIRVLAYLALFGGLVSTISRGPWVGAACAIGVAVALHPRAGRKISWVIGLGLLVPIVLFLTPYGDLVIGYLPFVGDVDPGSTSYRSLLWNLSTEVIRQNFWFGDLDYLSNPTLEPLRQGQGIIDIVNTYLQVALAFGMVGCVLFVTPFLVALRVVWRVRAGALKNGDESCEALSRAMLSTLVGILVTIATVSSIGLIPTVYWLVVGISIGMSKLLVEIQAKSPANAEMEIKKRRKLSYGYGTRSPAAGRRATNPNTY